MKTENKALASPEPYETPVLITEMELFINDMEHFIDYGNIVLTFENLPQDKNLLTRKLIRSATGVKEAYRKTLFQESVEDLEKRREDIFYEMSVLLEDFLAKENFLDQCLIYYAQYPLLRLQFPIKRILISNSATA